MTSNDRIKSRARDRAKREGVSYTKALHEERSLTSADAARGPHPSPADPRVSTGDPLLLGTRAEDGSQLWAQFDPAFTAMIAGGATSGKNALPRGPWDYPHLVVGQRIRFAGERTSMAVRAISSSGRFVALTKPFNLGRRSKILYSVIDFAKGIRGTATSYGVGFETVEQCEEALEAFEAHVARKEGVRGGEPVITSEVSYRNWVWLRFTDRQPDARTQEMLPLLRLLMAVAPERNYNDHEPRSMSLHRWVAERAVASMPSSEDTERP